MRRPLSLIIIAWITMMPGFALGLEPVQVMVFPFKINAQEDLAHLASEIPDVIGKYLKPEGAVLLEPVLSPEKPLDAMTPADFKAAGVANGADFVIWGSMTRIGQQFSLDVRMLEPFGDGPPHAVFREGNKIENLSAMVNDLSRSLGMKIFKQSTVATLKVTGNKRIEADAIQKVIKTKPGDIYSAKELSENLKSVYKMGYFDDVRVEAEDGPAGKTVVFTVKEKPTTRVVRFKGNRVFDDEELMENLSVSTGSILNVFTLEKNVKRIETLYKDKNYHNVKVSYTIQPLENEQADLVFAIQEGQKIWIKEITFEGNSAYNDRKLKKLMKTSEKGLLSWFTSSGDLSWEDLDRDVDNIAAFYSNNGYIKSKVSDPQVEYKPDGIYVNLKVEEGPRFKVGRVDIDGDIILTREELLEKVKIGEQEFFSREIVRNDVLALADLYSDQDTPMRTSHPEPNRTRRPSTCISPIPFERAMKSISSGSTSMATPSHGTR